MFINKFFDRLTIGERISSLQILACLCVLAVVGTSYFTLSRYKSVTQEADASLQHIGKVRDYQTRLLKLDQIVEFFLVARGDDTVGKIDNALAVLQSSVEEEYQEEIRLLGETTNKLRDLRIKLGLSEKEGLEGALRAAVHSVEKGLESAEQEELSAGSLDPVRVKMLMLRRHEKDFIMRGQQKYVERFNKRVDEFGVRLANTKLKPATKSVISEDMKAYQTAFLAWAETYSELRQTAETFRKLSIQTLEHEEKTIQADTLHYQELEAARQDVLASMLPINFGVSGLLLALYLLFGSMAVRGIKKPLRAISDALDRLSEGEEGVNIPEYKTEDEVGSLSDAATRFQMMVSNNKEIGRQQQEEANARAERAEQLDGLIGDLNAKLAGALEGVSGAMANASSQVGEVDSATFSTTTSAEKVNEAMKEASSRLLLMSSATTQLSQSSGEISIQMEEAFKVVNQASTQAHETSERITALVEATDKITSIVDLIQDIAERTNLLALNATIEAARAGEAGRGFSVVAHEVKQLASQTASATSEILSQVTEIQRETGNASSSVQTIAEFVSKIEMATQTVSSSIQQQDAATAEIASNVEDVNSKVETIEAAVKGINSSANDSTQSISTLKNSCNQVEDQLGTLETDIKAFLGSVQAA